MTSMRKLIEGLVMIESKFPNADTAAEHDQIWIVGYDAKNPITKESFSEEEWQFLDDRGFIWDDDQECITKFT